MVVDQKEITKKISSNDSKGWRPYSMGLLKSARGVPMADLLSLAKEGDLSPVGGRHALEGLPRECQAGV